MMLVTETRWEKSQKEVYNQIHLLVHTYFWQMEHESDISGFFFFFHRSTNKNVLCQKKKKKENDQFKGM